MLKYIGLTFAMLLLPNISFAAPIYLKCMLSPNNEIDFTLDEQAESATILTKKSGYTRTLQASFTVDKVVIAEDDDQWVIDRTNLTLENTITMIHSTTDGSCSIETPPKRKF